jgi:hypothetical protein
MPFVTSAQGKIFPVLVRAVSRRPILDHELERSVKSLRVIKVTHIYVMASIPYIAPEGWKRGLENLDTPLRC